MVVGGEMSPVYSDFPKLSTPSCPTRELQVCKCIKLYIKYTLTPSNRGGIAWHILMIQDRYVVTSHTVCLKVVKQQTKGERSEECPVGIKRVGIKKHPNFPVSVYHIYSVHLLSLYIKPPCRGRCRNNRRECVCLSLVLSSMILSSVREVFTLILSLGVNLSRKQIALLIGQR